MDRESPLVRRECFSLFLFLFSYAIDVLWIFRWGATRPPRPAVGASPVENRPSYRRFSRLCRAKGNTESMSVGDLHVRIVSRRISAACYRVTNSPSARRPSFAFSPSRYQSSRLFTRVDLSIVLIHRTANSLRDRARGCLLVRARVGDTNRNYEGKRPASR